MTIKKVFIMGLFKNIQMQGAQKNGSRGVYSNTSSDRFCSATKQTHRALQGMSVFQQPHRGFTMVEILIAIFILGLVMVTVYASYTGILRTSRQIEDEQDIYKSVRTAMDRLIKDLSSLQSTAGNYYLRSERRKTGSNEFQSVSFWSASHLAFGESQSAERPAQITYYVKENDDRKSFSLWRSDVSGAAPDEARKEEGGFLICRNVNVFRLTFYDSNGLETDSWDSSSSSGNQNGLAPAAVKIELFADNAADRGKPYKFMTKIFLPVKK